MAEVFWNNNDSYHKIELKHLGSKLPITGIKTA